MSLLRFAFDSRLDERIRCAQIDLIQVRLRVRNITRKYHRVSEVELAYGCSGSRCTNDSADGGNDTRDFRSEVGRVIDDAQVRMTGPCTTNLLV